MANEIATIVGTVAGSSVLAAAIGFIGKIVNDALQRRQKATYSALRAAIDLERYTEQIISQIPIAQYFDVDEARDPEYQGDYPAFPEFPGYSSEIEWRELTPVLTSRCLSYETEVHFAKKVISNAFSADDDAGIIELRDQLRLRSDRPANLAADLRKAYGLPELTQADLAGDSAQMNGLVVA